MVSGVAPPVGAAGEHVAALQGPVQVLDHAHDERALVDPPRLQLGVGEDGPLPRPGGEFGVGGDVLGLVVLAAARHRRGSTQGLQHRSPGVDGVEVDDLNQQFDESLHGAVALDQPGPPSSGLVGVFGHLFGDGLDRLHEFVARHHLLDGVPHLGERDHAGGGGLRGVDEHVHSGSHLLRGALEVGQGAQLVLVALAHRPVEELGGDQRLQHVQGVIDRGRLQVTGGGQQGRGLAVGGQIGQRRGLGAHPVPGQSLQLGLGHIVHLDFPGADPGDEAGAVQRLDHAGAGDAVGFGAQPLQLGEAGAVVHPQQVEKVGVHGGGDACGQVGVKAGVLLPAGLAHQPGEHAQAGQQDLVFEQVEHGPSNRARGPSSLVHTRAAR
jgi:hypothetical protein